MFNSLSFTRIFSLSLAVFASSTTFADSALSVEESDTILKEDIAAAQVMTELCPAIIGSNPVITQKVQDIVSEYLAELSNKSTTYQQLQSDAEYINILEQARTDMQETSATEQKEVCLELAQS